MRARFRGFSTRAGDYFLHGLLARRLNYTFSISSRFSLSKFLIATSRLREEQMVAKQIAKRWDV